MSAQTFCLYNHNNKSILRLLVLNPAEFCISYKAFFLLCVYVYVFWEVTAVILISLS